MSGKPHGRGKQIIRELYENGPISARGLRCLLEPPISKSGIKQALRVLKKHKLIVPDEMTRRISQAYSYQLSLTGDTRPTIAKMLDLPEAALKNPFIRNPDPFHSEECAIWCNWFRRIFSDAIVARDIHYKYDPRFKMPFTIDSHNWPLRPDILMRIPKEDDKRDITVVLDIEREYYSSERWADKIRKLAKSETIDGIICFGSVDMIVSVAEILFDLRKNKKGPRKDWSFAKQILFSTRGWCVSEVAPNMFDSELQPASLYKWISFLQSIPHEKPLEAVSETSAYRV